MNNKPLVSVIIPLFNKETVIRKTIDSVLSQTYHDFEIVVIDDGSTDHSVETIRQYDDSRISLYIKSNGGPSSARNYGTEKSTGNWILFLDADDTLQPNALERLVSPIISNETSVDLISGNYNIIKGTEVKRHHLSGYSGLIPRRKKMYWLFIGNCFPRTGVAIIRKDFLVIYPFPENFRRFEDMSVMIQWVKNGRVFIIPDILFDYSRDTEDASKPAKDYNQDFIFHMNFAKASFWEKCLLGNLYESGLKSYPKQVAILRGLYSKWDFYRYFGQLILLGQLQIRRYIVRD